VADDNYNPQAIEAKWQRRWAETAVNRTPPRAQDDTFYCLDFFPYPSGDGLSVGHGRNYVPTDVISRYHRMQGDAVLHPMGWDAFGLPAENEAIKKGRHPRETTTRYAANYRRQMTLIGCSYDWEREINSSTPEFYRWTQWFFLLLYRRGLAYRAVGRQWWCPGCKTVLADEQVESGGVCWRGHAGVVKRDLEQWYFRITAYADELLAALEMLDWPEHILAMQQNWIGRSEGVEFEMLVHGSGERFTVYTTRPDTVYGMTFAVLAPEHPLVASITTPERSSEVTVYCEEAARRSELDRLQAGRDGVFTGTYAINPANGARVPIYVADYVLLGYGGGAIMAVPAHDERDFDFAARHGIPAPVVIAPPDWDGGPLAGAYVEPGQMVNSGPWDGLPSEGARDCIARWMEEQADGALSAPGLADQPSALLGRADSHRVLRPLWHGACVGRRPAGAAAARRGVAAR
jgi:leucyl-tRNA synthetase